MRVLALIALLIAPVPGLAEGGWYLFIDGGLPRTATSMSRQANDAELVAAGFTVISSSESSGETSLAIGAGYRLSAHVALEASYIDLGQLHLYNGTVTSGPNSGSRVKDWEGSAFGLAVIGLLPLRYGFSLLGKAAAYRMKGEYRTETLIFAPPPFPGAPAPIVLHTRDTANGSGTIPAMGIGLSFRAAEEIEVRAVYEWWRAKAGLFGAGNDLDRIRMIFLGAAYRF